MRFEPVLQRATLLRRYKRFLADVRLADGRELTVHCPNPGAMTGCAQAGWEVALSHSPDPRRKLPYTLEMVHDGSVWIGVNTQRANAIVAEALEQGRIAELQGYTSLQREVRYGEKSRIDFLLTGPAGLTYLEVKSVTLNLDGVCAFPDAVTTRGRRHLEELVQMKRAGHRAVLLFVVQRGDGQGFRPAHEIDPDYADTLQASRAQGVELLICRARLDPGSWELADSGSWL
ncbi:MAG: DNA/RNA nuclease SfsA [Candidatus Sericytochromatia bacterium]